MITPFITDYSGEGISVKGEERVVEVVSKLFKPEEEVVEREIKRPLTATPEEYAKPKRLPGDPKTAAGWRYRIRRDLLDKQGRRWGDLFMCPGCLERKGLRLYRVNKNNDPPKESDYVLLCSDCVAKRIAKRKEEEKKNKLWSRGPGVKGGSPENSKTAFFNSIRALVFERDGKECPYCGSKENLGLAALMPLSRGGKLCFDNYTVSCQKCRGARSGSKYSKAMTPLEYFWQREWLKGDLSESLDDEPVVKNPGARASVNMHLVAEIQQYLHRIAAGGEIDRSKAERLAIKLSETDEDRKKERERFLW